MHETYDPKIIEPKWQETWEKQGLYKTVEDLDRPKWYALTMFVYPSGDIHAGHWYAFIPSDVSARWRRMNGYNVFFPVGFDAFGLPAENAAIKRGIHPKAWTYSNIAKMRFQLKRMGAMWAWDREVITCDPEYYKWTQWFFLKFYENDLAYREYAPVDWCPSCNTTLAREQVWGDDRHCERCRTPVIKKNLEQWKFRITRYADALLAGLTDMDWPERVKLMQNNWIGKSSGAEIYFNTEQGDTLTVFTTRPETAWGATFMVLSPEHPLVAKLTPSAQQETVRAYQEQAARQDEMTRKSTDKEITGVFTGGYAINPVNGERIPIWIADYVLMGYGTGAIMAVPAHDSRDFAFAKRFALPIRCVVRPPGRTGDDVATLSCPDRPTGGLCSLPPAGGLDEAYESKTEGVMVNSGDLNGTPVAEAFQKAVTWLESKGKGKPAVSFRLRDWLISRQRMWGAPIPIVYCASCGIVPVPQEALPVVLPDDAEFRPTGESPLKYHKGFRFVKCPRCGANAERETDTMDTFMCSSWYQYAYLSPYYKKGESLTAQNTSPWDPAIGQYWLPVDQYTGGIEHATMHLLYTRFFTKALHDMGIVHFDEPMRRLFNQGMILGPDGEKMSKSRGNVINPDSVVNEYGTDTVRGYMMFIGPWDQGGPWDPSAIDGISRFLQRTWNLILDHIHREQLANTPPMPHPDQVNLLEQTMHQTIIKITEGMSAFRFNTVIAHLMEFSNTLLKMKSTSVVYATAWGDALRNFILLMAPLFPHISEELWHRLGNTESVHLQKWPQADVNKAKMDRTTVVVQINSRVRSQMTAPLGMSDHAIEQQALELSAIKKWLENKRIRKVIVVPDRLINIVTD